MNSRWAAVSPICKSHSIFSNCLVGGYVCNLCCDFNSSYYSPASLPFTVIQNLLTAAPSCRAPTGILIIPQTRLFYLPPSPFMGSMGANEDVFLMKMRWGKLPQSVRFDSHAYNVLYWFITAHCRAWEMSTLFECDSCIFYLVENFWVYSQEVQGYHHLFALILHSNRNVLNNITM